jgi:tetratricopeptide (TPR) repeat protein
LGVAYLIRQFIQQAMGRPADAAATLRAALDLEREAPPNPLLYDNLAFLAGRLALLEASRGNAAQANEALAVNARLDNWLSSKAPAGGFFKASRSIFPEAWRVAVLPLVGDDQRTLDLGRALIPKLEQLQPVDEPQRQLRSNVLRGAHLAIAQSAYVLKDYPAAEREMTKVLELRKQVPNRTTSDKREAAGEQAFAALVFARANRQEDAQKLIAPVLKFERDLSPSNHDDPSQRFDLAVALYVAAVVGLGDSASQLSEANALIEKLPPEMRRLKDVAIWQDRIAEERSRRRQT